MTYTDLVRPCVFCWETRSFSKVIGRIRGGVEDEDSQDEEEDEYDSEDSEEEDDSEEDDPEQEEDDEHGRDIEDA